MRSCQYSQCGMPVDSDAPWGLAFCDQHQPNLSGRKIVPVDTCGKGHVFTPENTYEYGDGRRKCKACLDDYRRAHLPDHCKKGHEFTPATTRYSKNGSRICGVCRPQQVDKCKKGHEFTASNTGRVASGRRVCLTCRYERELAQVVPPKKHKGVYPLRCEAGHLYTAKNTRFNGQQKRVCLVCEGTARRAQLLAENSCVNGHHWRNSKIVEKLAQTCLDCRREADRRYFERTHQPSARIRHRDIPRCDNGHLWKTDAIIVQRARNGCTACQAEDDRRFLQLYRQKAA